MTTHCAAASCVREYTQARPAHRGPERTPDLLGAAIGEEVLGALAARQEWEFCHIDHTWRAVQDETAHTCIIEVAV